MIKGSGYCFNGKDYTAYFKGKQIGIYATAGQAWRAVGRKAWNDKLNNGGKREK